MMVLRKLTISLWAFVILAILGSGCASANAASDGQVSKSPRIIAIGDIHGDFEAYQAVIIAAGLSDEKGKWVGGDTIFVQTGDIPDRGPDTLKIIDHIRSLQKQAKRNGGKVITLVGNHEAMNMTDDLRYVHPGEYAAFVTSKSDRLRERSFDLNRETITAFYRQQDPLISEGDLKAAWMETMPLGKIEHQQAWRPKGKIGKWVAKNPGVALVEGNLFAHGGLSMAYGNHQIDDLNADITKALKNRETTESSVINDPLGPLWYRGYSRGEQSPSQVDMEMTSQEELNQVLTLFGAKRMIVGHTPQRSGITMGYNGKFIQIDTGMSKHYGGTRSFLRIENGQVFAHDNGSITPL